MRSEEKIPNAKINGRVLREEGNQIFCVRRLYDTYYSRVFPVVLLLVYLFVDSRFTKNITNNTPDFFAGYQKFWQEKLFFLSKEGCEKEGSELRVVVL